MGFYDDEQVVDSTAVNYVLKVRKQWFRGKDVFTDRLYVYEKALVDRDSVKLQINAGNMIYVMMRRLEIGVDWEKQNSLIHSYRDLMYKLSYVNVVLYRDDMICLHIEGEKSDVMWAVTFITQVFPEEPMDCITLSEADKLQFGVQDGNYSGATSERAAVVNDVLPNIWQADVASDKTSVSKGVEIVYDATHEPASGEIFAIPDGRIAQYIRMDERFQIAERYGTQIDAITRHNISASLIKDFEDLVNTQTHVDYNLYKMRYVAYMNKVHDLEKKIGGFEISCYDILPIGERGLPYASKQTLDRTNKMDCGSLKYALDKVKRNSNHLSDKERKELMQEIGLTVLYRIDGYDIEFQTYGITGSNTELCADVRLKYCYELYADFAEIESYNILSFPKSVYRAMCNDPENAVYQMTPFERQRLQLFGRGYYNFVEYQVNNVNNKKLHNIYEKALNRLTKAYLR